MRFLSIIFFLFVFPATAHADDSVHSAFYAADKKEWGDARIWAQRSQNKDLIDYITWRELRNTDSRSLGEEYLIFLEQHPLWPEQEQILRRGSEALLIQGYTPDQAARWQKLYQRIHKKQPEIPGAAEEQLRHYAWEHGVFVPWEQEQILGLYAGQIDLTDISQRASDRLWQGDIAAARALLPRLPSTERRLLETRMALMNSDRKVESLLNTLSTSQRNDPGLMFDRMRWRDRKGLTEGVEEILRLAPSSVPYPEKWWPYRATIARDQIEAGQYQRALGLLRNHGQTEGATLADALWLRGWLQFQFLKAYGEAYKDFHDLYKNVKFPVSQSRAAYWAGRAAEANGNKEIARQWYGHAAEHPHTFYGQLGVMALPGSAILKVGDHSKPSNQARFTAQEQDLINLIEVLARYRQDYSVELFLKTLLKHQKNPANGVWLGEMANRLGYPHYAIRLAKQASQDQHWFLQGISHPIREVPVPRSVVEPSLALAITRQESEFDPRAQSSANAMGMMQLLPSTAKHVARKNGMGYDYSRLYEPQYNMTLGSQYLNELLAHYGGSYVLTIAAYNAGQGNVRKWTQRFGYPNENSLDDTLRWMELIPFLETRNYVQRVLENMLTYRAIQGDATPLTPGRVFREGR
jgi:soluble lytic murein transglycosylase